MKNKWVKAIISTVLALTTVLCGCGGEPQRVDSENLLEIYVLEQGYGIDWCYNTVEAFKKQDWVKEKYPDLEIAVTVNDVVGFSLGQLKNGQKYNSFDLLFGALMDSYYGSEDVLDLTECVYNSKVPGEETTYSEKLNDSLEASLSYYDSSTGETCYYAAPYYSGMYGFIYNEDALKSYDLKVPNTTDEFIAVCDAIYNANKSKGLTDGMMDQYAFIQSKDAPYWEKEGSVLEVWWAQYEGVDGYEDFYKGVVSDQRSIDIFKQKGRLESLKMMEELLDYDNGFLHPQSFNQEYMVQQTAFLQGAAVFHYNGDYFTDEMKEIKARLIAAGETVPVIKMMKTPIISSIVEKCSTIKGENGGTADQELSALVSAIDAKSTALKGEGYDVSQKDFNKVKEARSIVNSVGPAPSVIPSYAKGKDIAVDFLRFMATDEGIMEFAKGASGATLDFFFDPKEADAETFNSFEPLQQGRIEYMCDKENAINILKKPSSFPLCSYGGVQAFVDISYYTTLSGSTNKKTAQDFYDETLTYWTQNAWFSALTSAGLY